MTALGVVVIALALAVGLVVELAPDSMYRTSDGQLRWWFLYLFGGLVLVSLVVAARTMW